jgi:hypothetical protein
MQPARILPDLQCSLVCDDVRREINGNFMLFGILTGIGVPQLPVVAARLFVFNRWTAGVGQFTECVRLIAPDQTTQLARHETRFALQQAAHNFTSVTVFGNVEFKSPGVYYVEVQVDDVMKIRYPLPVVLVQVPQPQQQQPQPPPASASPAGPPAPPETATGSGPSPTPPAGGA